MRQKLIILITLAAVVSTTSCSAKQPSEKAITQNVIATDTVMHKAVGDSIYRVITNVKKIEITSLPLQSDSVRQTLSKKVPSSELGLMKFIATNPKNFMSDTILYGVFMPQFEATYTAKKGKVTLKYDFGLRKWGIFDAEGKQIALFDLSSDNMLRFACQQFPDNVFFHELLMTREPNDK